MTANGADTQVPGRNVVSSGFQSNRRTSHGADSLVSNPFDLQVGGNVVGPVPLEKYDPGVYTVKLKITDNVAKKDVLRELSFEVK